jgi:hypothetical protein
MTMLNTMKRSRPEMDASDRNERSLVDIVADIESRSKDQSRDLDLLRERVDAVMAQKEEIAARLGEAVGDLAKTRAAPESERRKRETSEAKPGSVKAAMSAARAALDMVIDGDPESGEPENTLTGHENDGAAEAVIVTGDDRSCSSRRASARPWTSWPRAPASSTPPP